MSVLRFEHLLTPGGFIPGEIRLDDNGRITAVEAASLGPWDGWIAIPGMVNAHSHSFQRAMCGLAEQAQGERNFWGWRETMYRIAQTIGPGDQYLIACQLFAEMLAAGYTTVGEFHYLHHLPDGKRDTQMATAVIAAAADTGIRLAMLPVLYQRGGFSESAHRLQRRFLYDSVDEFLDYVAALGAAVAGVAPHSLRALDIDVLVELVHKARERLGQDAVFHIHIAEQTREVEQCLGATGATPVRFLAEHMELDARWSLVHATHIDAVELQTIVAADANVVLCPLTEANLGDGIFPAVEFAAQGGRFAIGSDCNARIDAVEELRMLEYGQRLVNTTRAALANDQGLGQRLWSHAAATGARSLNIDCGQIVAGAWADLVVLGSGTPLAGLAPARALDALVCGGSGANIEKVYVGGRQVNTTANSADRRFVDLIARLAQQS